MSGVFLRLLNISINAGWIVLIIAALRIMLKRVPKWFRVAAWGLVALRLLIPVSIESSFRLVPSAETVSFISMSSDVSKQDAALRSALQEEQIVIETGIPPVNRWMNPIAEQTAKRADTVAVVKAAAGWVWLAGVCGMLLYALIGYLIPLRKGAQKRNCAGSYQCAI